MLSDEQLPPLPEPEVHDAAGYRRAFTADQMREYGSAVERAAYERAATECSALREALHDRGVGDQSYDIACDDCADAIRSLMTQEQPK